MNSKLIAKRIIQQYEPRDHQIVREILSARSRRERTEIEARVIVGWIVNVNNNKRKENEGN